jgi:uncharacterized paraquat-inducible protein A
MFIERTPPFSLLPSCAAHPVAYCRQCQLSFRLAELAYAALAPEPFHRCPRCRADLTLSLQQHARSCPGAVP